MSIAQTYSFVNGATARFALTARQPWRKTVRVAALMRLCGVLGGSIARSSSLGDGVSDRSAVLQSVVEVDHLVAVVPIAPVGGTRRRWEAVPLLPQPQRVRADVEHPGCFVDRERGSTLLLMMYRQPGSIPLALSGIADGSRTGAARRRASGSRTRPHGWPPRRESDARSDTVTYAAVTDLSSSSDSSISRLKAVGSSCSTQRAKAT